MVDYNTGWEIWTDNRIYGATPRHIRNMIRTMIRELEYGSVLDIGCGNGNFLNLIEKTSGRKGLKTAGIDSSEKAIEIAKSLNPKSVFKVLDIEKGNLEGKYDLVVCNDVLEHLNDDAGALTNIKNMTGRYFICNTIQGTMREQEKRIGHVRNYKKGELIEKLKKAGFKPLKIIEWGFPFYDILCRKLNIGTNYDLIYGRYGVMKKMLSNMAYILFMLNSKHRGDVLIVLSEVAG